MIVRTTASSRRAVEEWVFYDHPGQDRIHMAMKWKAEHLNDVKTRT